MNGSNKPAIIKIKALIIKKNFLPNLSAIKPPKNEPNNAPIENIETIVAHCSFVNNELFFVKSERITFSGEFNAALL